MINSQLVRLGLRTILLVLLSVPAGAQSCRVQCPTSTITHPTAADNEPTYAGPTYTGTNGYGTTPAHVNGAIKCQQISGGDGYATMGDGTQTYLFSFGPLSGLGDIAKGLPGTEFPSIFNARFPVSTSNYLVPGDPATTIGVATVGGLMPLLTPAQFAQLNVVYNGSVGLDYDVTNSVNILFFSETGTTVTVVGYVPLDLNLKVGNQVVIAGGGTDVPAGYKGTFAVT